MKTNRTYETRIYFASENPKIALANAERLVDINCKNKNFRYRYNRIVKETREKFAKSSCEIDQMYPVIYKTPHNFAKDTKSRKLYCVSVLHFVEDPEDNFHYNKVEAVANLREMSDNEFLEYVANNRI